MQRENSLSQESKEDLNMPICAYFAVNIQDLHS